MAVMLLFESVCRNHERITNDVKSGTPVGQSEMVVIVLACLLARSLAFV
jgi:hypothetical protein